MMFSTPSLQQAIATTIHKNHHDHSPPVSTRFLIVRRGDIATMEGIRITSDVFVVAGKGLAPHGQLGWNRAFLSLVIEAVRDLEDDSNVTKADLSEEEALVVSIVKIYTEVKQQHGRFFIKRVVATSSNHPLREYWEELSIELSLRLIAKCVVGAVAKKHETPLSTMLKQQQLVARSLDHHVMTSLLDRLSLVSATTDDEESSGTETNSPPIIVSSFHDSRDGDQNGRLEQEQYAQAVLNHIAEQQPETLLVQPRDEKNV